MKSTLFTAIFSAILVFPLMAYQPALNFDHKLSCDVFGNEVMIRHFEGSNGWNGSVTDGAYLSFSVGNYVYFDIRCLTLILILIGVAAFFALVKATLRIKRQNKTPTHGADLEARIPKGLRNKA